MLHLSGIVHIHTVLYVRIYIHTHTHIYIYIINDVYIIDGMYGLTTIHTLHVTFNQHLIVCEASSTTLLPSLALHDSTWPHMPIIVGHVYISSIYCHSNMLILIT